MPEDNVATENTQAEQTTNATTENTEVQPNTGEPKKEKTVEEQLENNRQTKNTWEIFHVFYCFKTMAFL